MRVDVTMTQHADSLISVLLIEDDPVSVRLLRTLLESATQIRFELTHADRLSPALEHLCAGGVDVVLLDLLLPDSAGLETLLRVRAKAPGVPVVILTELDDEDVAVEAVQRGARDYLIKGELSGTLLVRAIRDAVERQRLLREVDRLREQQLQAKNELLSHVSHELRSPLTAIYQFVTILLDGLAGELTPEQREYLEIGLRNVNRLRGMIDELLEVSRADTGKLDVEPECISIAEPIVETLGTLRESAETKGIALSAEIPGSLPPVYADPARVRQILTNLVENAIKFTPGQGSVSIRARVCEPDPRFLSLEVVDTGCGISPDGVQRVFDRFHQEANSADGSRKGLGLGLYISKELVSRHGGRIWVESGVGVGSTFTVTLPVFSLAGLLAPTITENGRLRGPIALTSLRLCPRAGGFSKRNLDALVKQAREIVRASMLPDLDVVLPRMASTGEGELYLVAVCPEWRGPDAAVGRIREQFGRAPEFQSADVDLTVTATLVETPLQRDGVPLEELVEEVADQVLELTTAVLPNEGGRHGQEEDPDHRRRSGPAAWAVGPIAGE